MITLGLLSDTHSRAEIAQHAVDLLIQHGADILIHLGDVGSVEVIDTLATVKPGQHRQIEAHMVLGNCDWPTAPLATYARDLGMMVHDPAGELILDDKRVAFTHGHLPSAMDQALASGADYLLHGHTHQQSDTQAGVTRIINPGALFRASRHTVALLTPSNGELRILDVASVVR